VVRDLRQGKRTYKQLSQKHSISVSTIHRIAEAEGLTTKRTRTSATEIPEETYDSSNRKAALDRLMKSVDDQVSRGGQSSKQLLDLARAAKEISSARANEDKLSESYAEASLGGTQQHQNAEAFELVDCHQGGTPKHLGIYFGVLDWGEAIEAGEKEAAEEIRERVMEFCIEAGLHPSKVVLEKMLKKIKYDFGQEVAAQEKARERRRSPASLKGASEAEYSGEGRS
jgi:hypothetical protein